MLTAVTLSPTRSLGSILVDAKVLSEPSLADALGQQRDSGKRLGTVLVEMGLVDDQTIVAALGIQLDLPVTDLRSYAPHGRPSRSLPESAGPPEATNDSAAPFDHGDDLLLIIVADALRAGASDICIEPRKGNARVHHRIDGALAEAACLTTTSGAAVIRRAKRLAGRHTGTRRRIGATGGQHRRFDLTVDGRRVRVLVTASMTVQGERLRMRLVPDTTEGMRRLDELGMPPQIRRSFAAELARPSGLIVIAGPRRSGRTTTAYAAVDEMDTRQRSVVTVQRLVAHVLPSVSQIEIGTEPVVHALLAAVADQDADSVVIDDLEGTGVTRTAIRMAQRGLLVVMTMTAVDVAHLLDTGGSGRRLAGTRHSVLTQRLGAPAGSDPSARRVATFELVTDD